MSIDEEKLIVLVGQYPELYDVQHKKYMNTCRKNQLWNEIGQEIGVNENICKEKWKSLRDGYHSCLKNRKCKSGGGASKIKKWKYENQMEFLQQYLYERKTKGNFGDAGSITTDDNVNSFHEMDPISPEPANSLSSSSATSTMFKNISARKKNKTSEPSVASVLQKYMDSRSSTTTPTTKDNEHPIYSFFKAMADSVATFPPDLQLKAKNQIYLTVSNLEYENLQRKSTAGQTQNIQVQQVQLDDSTDTYLGEQFEEPCFNEPQNTPTVRTQTIHVPEVHTDSHTESQGILAPVKYILTADGRLLKHVNYDIK